MNALSIILVNIVAVEAFFIMGLEMFFSQTKMAQKAFDLPAEYLAQKEARIALANQGLYNGFLGVGIIFTELMLSGAVRLIMLYLFTGFVLVAAAFGALTANKKIIITQGLPAILALLALVLANN